MRFPISTGREYKYSLKSAAFAAALLFLSFTLYGETLWDQNFKGYIADGAALKVGDIIAVGINSTTTLTLSASHVDSQEGKLSFTGGEGKALFSFLPEGSSSTVREVEEDSTYALETKIPVRIVERDQNGLLNIEGQRSVTINGNTETVRISGLASAESVNSQGVLQFEDLYNAVLEYTSPGLEPSEFLTVEDINRSEPEPAEPPAPLATATPEADNLEQTLEQQSAEEQSNTATAGSTLSLTPEKQQELLLQFFNRFISTLFRPTE
ncbi:MAG: flagellar basal body L-ring protein FlgH [Spirochaetia bacterium]|nr:flagellar basal body L-ring protein FlgH [Spirochaetia bacterium]